MDSIYSRLVDLQHQIIQNTINHNYPTPILETLSVAQLDIQLTKEEADDIIRTIRRSAPSKKAGKLTSLPLFKTWFYRFLTNKFNLVPAVWDVFLTFGNIDPSNCSITLMNQLDSFFQEGISAFFEPSTFQALYAGYGLSLMAQINRDYTILNNLDEILMLKQFFKTVNDGSQNKLFEEAQIVGYYVPSLSDSVVRMILAAQDTATLQKLMLIKNWNNTNKSLFDISYLGSLLRDFKTRALQDSNEPYPEIMLTNAAKPNESRNNTQNKNNKSKNKNKNYKKKFSKQKKYKKSNNGSSGKRSNYNNNGSSDNKSNFYTEDFDLYSEDEYYNEVVGQNPSDGKIEEIYHVDRKSDISHASFIVDTGATAHVINNPKYFTSFKKSNIIVNSVHGKKKITSIGTVKVGKLTLKDVLYIPSSTKNIISLAKIVDGTDGYTWVGSNTKITFRKGKSIVAEAHREGKFFWLHSKKFQIPAIFNIEKVKSMDMQKEITMSHVALGHASPSRVKTYLERTLGKKASIYDIKNQIKHCICREINVPKKKGSKVKKERNYSIGELIHLDVIGPVDHHYAIIGTDRASNYVVSKILTSRDQVTTASMDILKHYINLLRLRNMSICFVRADNEFRTKKFREFCSSNGIVLENTAPYSSYQNGTAEVMNKIIQYKMRKLLQGGNVPKQYWTYAFNHAVFLHNHFDFRINGSTPWETLREMHVKVDSSIHLPPFGCKITSYNNNTVQKVFRENFNGVFLGFNFTTKIAYVLLGNGKIIRSSSFQTFDHIYPYKQNGPKYLLNDDIDNEYLDNVSYPSGTNLSTFGVSSSGSTGIMLKDSKVTKHKNPVTSKQRTSKSSNTASTLVTKTISDNHNTANQSDVLHKDSTQTSEIVPNTSAKSTELQNNPIPLSTSISHTNSLQVFANDQLNEPKELESNTNSNDSMPNEVVETTSTTIDDSQIVDQTKQVNETHVENFIPITDITSVQQNNNATINNSIINSEIQNPKQCTTKVSKMSSKNPKDQKAPKISQVLKAPKTRSRKVQAKDTSVSQSDQNLQSKSIQKSTNSRTKSVKQIARSKSTASRSDVNPRSPRRAHDPTGSNSKEICQSKRIKKHQSTSSTELIRPPISDQTKQQVLERKKSLKKPKSRQQIEISNELLPNPIPAKRLIPSKRLAENDTTEIGMTPENFKTLQPVNPYKRITRSMTQKSSIAGEKSINIANNTTENSDQIINLLVSSNKYDIPNTFKQAMKTPQKASWIKACEEELNAMKKLNVYKTVNKIKLQNQTVIKGRWVFNVKQEADGTERFKARLVAKGFTQELGQNYIETFSPVIAMDSIRFLLSMSAINGWYINQMDAKNAFLNGKLKYDIYFQPPEGCGIQQNQLWKLNKALYGLKNAPLIFYQTMSNVLYKSGFKSSFIDPCIIYNSELRIYIAMYVDDLLIFGSSKENIEKTKNILRKSFEMKDLGAPKIFLGMTIKRYNKNHVKLSMEDTIEKLEKDYQIKVKQRIINTPLEKGFNAKDENSPILENEQHSEFRRIIGSLLYITNTVRLDIAYPVSLLSSYLVTPRICHLNAAYRIIHYLIQTRKKGLNYTNELKLQIPTKDYRLLDTNKKAIIQDYPKRGEYLVSTVTDASFANEENRHSQSGSITYLNNNIITWMSKKQTLVALSSAESEYIAMTEALKSTIHFKNLLNELSFNTTYAKLCSDNMASLQLSSHKIHHQRTKHIDLRYHFIREKIQSKLIKLEYVNTKDNTADCLTKLVDTPTMKRLDSYIFEGISSNASKAI
jgi:hypothetical protein